MTRSLRRSLVPLPILPDRIHSRPMALTKAQSRQRWAELRNLVADWDPLGLLGMGAPADEYDWLLTPLLKLLQESARAEQVASFLEGEFAGRLGLDVPPDFRARIRFFAERFSELSRAET